MVVVSNEEQVVVRFMGYIMYHNYMGTYFGSDLTYMALAIEHYMS